MSSTFMSRTTPSLQEIADPQELACAPTRPYISQLSKKGLQCPPCRCHYRCIMRKKTKTELGEATLASVTKEMAKPRMARSARIAQLKMDSTRTPERPSITLPGIVDQIVPSPRPSQPEKAHIAVDGADHRYRDLRVENTFIDEHGDDVKLKKGAAVDVTISGDPRDVSGHS
jgi:hypothetical protein